MENFFCNSSLLKKQLKRKKTSSASFHAQTSFSIPQSDLDLQQSNTNSISQSTNLLPQHARTHHNPHVSEISASQSTSVSNSVNLNVTPAGSAANPLTTVPPRLSMHLQGMPSPNPKRHVYISRLSKDQSSYDVMAYVQNKIQGADISVDKFNFNYPREISSFKISCSESVFANICHAHFWPEHIFVAEYKGNANRKRDRNQVMAPLYLLYLQP